MRSILQTFSSDATHQAAVTITPYTCIRWVLGSNLGWISGYPDRRSFIGGLFGTLQKAGICVFRFHSFYQ